MNTVPGYEMSSWERGYGDFVFRPDLDTLRLLPWLDERRATHVPDLDVPRPARYYPIS